MKASDLLIEQCSNSAYMFDALNELIDKHNMLVRHAFATAETPVQTNTERDYIGMKKEPPLVAGRRAWLEDKTQQIRFCHRLLIDMGHVCNHVFNTTSEVITGVIKCDTCGLPVVVLGD